MILVLPGRPFLCLVKILAKNLTISLAIYSAMPMGVEVANGFS